MRNPRFPAPPFYRQQQSGGGRINGNYPLRVRLQHTTTGVHQANTCVPPVVVTDMLGNRVVHDDRSVRIDQTVHPDAEE